MPDKCPMYISAITCDNLNFWDSVYAEYKRRQAAPGAKIGRKLFGRDRRYPITNGYRDAR